jgi:hypothetical protein
MWMQGEEPTFRVASSKAPRLASKYLARVDVADSDKHSSLLRYRINYGRKKFCITGPLSALTMQKNVLWGQYYKDFYSVIYNFE